jgi:hypothetical protein
VPVFLANETKFPADCEVVTAQFNYVCFQFEKFAGEIPQIIA